MEPTISPLQRIQNNATPVTSQQFLLYKGFKTPRMEWSNSTLVVKQMFDARDW